MHTEKELMLLLAATSTTRLNLEPSSSVTLSGVWLKFTPYKEESVQPKVIP